MFNTSWGDMYPDLMHDPVKARMHVDHCIEALRLALMCNSDVTPMLFLLDPKSPVGARADFNIHRKCRNFDNIVEYVKENGVEISI
jgi:hypothetical protein